LASSPLPVGTLLAHIKLRVLDMYMVQCLDQLK
jgi:hypothetical protein